MYVSAAHVSQTGTKDRDVEGLEYMIVYRAEDFLRRNDQMCHLPYCSFKIHLRELE